MNALLKKISELNKKLIECNIDYTIRFVKVENDLYYVFTNDKKSMLELVEFVFEGKLPAKSYNMKEIKEKFPNELLYDYTNEFRNINNEINKLFE
ncbi:MAG: hypothetical protein NTU73_00420 [Ignavibacteriae bacterium]|nr:hypothetical protein [Ignavibacteriota bacterium]